MNKDELLKLQFDYAWKWFDYHAKQRISMFHFFLIITGILANAYVALLKVGITEIAFGIGFLGGLTSVGFFCLDCRNSQLVKMGEDVLENLERNHIFTTKFKIKKKSKELQGGFLFREAVEEPKTLEEKPLLGLLNKIIKHKVWIRTIEFVLVVCFIIAMILPFSSPGIFQSHKSNNQNRIEEKVTNQSDIGKVDEIKKSLNPNDK